MHFRAMIFYDFKCGLNFHQSHERLVLAFGDRAPSEETVRLWFKEFERGRRQLEDEPRSGRPADAVTDENIRLVEKLIREERNITVREIEQEVGINVASVERILHNHLGVHKVASRWVPHLLTPEQKEQRVDWCHFMLQKFNDGRSKRVNDIVTGDETWIYAYDPETKQQSTVWVFDDEPPPTKVVRSKSMDKQMVAVFFRRTGIIAVIPVPKGKTVNAQWYTGVCLPQVFEKLHEQRPSAGVRGILLHHDNAPAHTAARTIDFLHDAGVQLVSHPPYSPDLAPCDFNLFGEVKNKLRGKRFQSAEEAIAAFNEVLEMLSKNDFHVCFDKWFLRMNKCISADGDYFEKV